MYSQQPEFNSQPGQSFKSPRPQKWYRKWWGKVLITFSTIFLAVLVAWGFYVGNLVYLINTGKVSPVELFGQDSGNNQALTGQELPTMATPDDPSTGPKNAKVVIVEFADFECSACGEAYPVVKEILNGYGDKINFVFRDFPIVDLHSQALLASLAAQCAHEQGEFWPMYDKMFQNQLNLQEGDLKRYALQIGLNGIQFGNCLESQKYFDEVEADLNDGLAAGVGATPTFFINGVKIEGVIPLSGFQRIIVAELNR